MRTTGRECPTAAMRAASVPAAAAQWAMASNRRVRRSTASRRPRNVWHDSMSSVNPFAAKASRAAVASGSRTGGSASEWRTRAMGAPASPATKSTACTSSPKLAMPHTWSSSRQTKPSMSAWNASFDQSSRVLRTSIVDRDFIDRETSTSTTSIWDGTRFRIFPPSTTGPRVCRAGGVVAGAAAAASRAEVSSDTLVRSACDTSWGTAADHRASSRRSGTRSSSESMPAFCSRSADAARTSRPASVSARVGNSVARSDASTFVARDKTITVGRFCRRPFNAQ
mmetsp:Transcript_50042/g.154618  ORF Transcript_50042/g.154618 Transcript_50042/m.154618 type:complete len:282 (-) Transcript_50042:19-864(-)